MQNLRASGNRKRTLPKATFRLRSTESYPLVRGVRASRHNPRARMLRSADADAVPCSSEWTEVRQIVRGSCARAENKRVTGGSRRAIFGIPTRATWHASFRRALFAWRLFRSPLRYSSHAAPIARVLVSAPPSSITRFFSQWKRFASLFFLSFSLSLCLSTSLSSALYPVTARCGTSSRWRLENGGQESPIVDRINRIRPMPN